MTPADSSSANSEDDSLNEVAALWLARRESGFDARQAAAFARWRDADPRHAAALRRAQATQHLLARLPETPGVAAMLAEVDALCAPRKKILSFSLIWKVSAALAAAACITVLLWPAKSVVAETRGAYVTDASHHQTVNLSDGSTLVLNASSAIAVDFQAAERRVQLERGEAHFYVAKDPDRPFYVTAGTVTVRAVGTAFNVRRQVGAVEVLVTEGKVKVSRDDPPSGKAALEPIFLVAGERAFIDGVPVAASANGQASSDQTALSAAQPVQRAPRLMFNNTPLSDVVERFNRYSRVQMEIADADLAGRSVGGNFDADNAESFINLLSVAGDVRVERVSETRVRLHKAP
jgi:transmembrane sensor